MDNENKNKNIPYTLDGRVGTNLPRLRETTVICRGYVYNVQTIFMIMY